MVLEQVGEQLVDADAVAVADADYKHLRVAVLVADSNGPAKLSIGRQQDFQGL